MPPASPKANTIKQWNPGSRIGKNRPQGLEPSGGVIVPLPQGGVKGEVGQTIFDKACRYDAADPEANCKAVFGGQVDSIITKSFFLRIFSNLSNILFKIDKSDL